MRHRMVLAAALASLVALGSIGPVAAFEPNSQTNEMQDWTGPQQPVGPGQRATADKKLVLAAQFAKEDAARANGEVTVAATTTESYLVGTWERQQVNYYYCGPAAIQVEADYVWNMGPDKVKWKLPIPLPTCRPAPAARLMPPAARLMPPAARPRRGPDSGLTSSRRVG